MPFIAPPIGLDAPRPANLHLIEAQKTIEGAYAWYGDDTFDIPMLFLPGAKPSGSLAAVVLIDDESLDRAEAVLRFCRRLIGRSAPDRRLTPFRRQRIPLELRAADARAHDATYRDIAEAIHGAARLAREDDWRTSPLRTEAIDLVDGGEALIAGGYRKLLRHRRRS